MTTINRCSYAEIYKVYNHIYACKSSINLIYYGYFSAMEAMSHPIDEQQFTLWQTFT